MAGSSLPNLRSVHAALFAVQIIFAVNVIAVRKAEHYVENAVVVFLRELICTTLMSVVAHVHAPSREYSCSRLETKILIALGLLGVVGHTYFSSLGTELTSALTTSVFATTRPVFTLISALYIGTDLPCLYKIVGVVLAMGGSLVEVKAWEIRGNAEHFTLGCMALVLSNLCYAGYLVLLKMIIRTCPVPFTLARVFYVGIGGLFVICTVQMKTFVALNTAPKEVWLIAAFGGFVVSPVSYGLCAFAVKHSSPVLVATYSCLVTPITMTISFVVFNDTVGQHEAIGIAVIALGVFVVAFGERRVQRMLRTEMLIMESLEEDPNAAELEGEAEPELVGYAGNRDFSSVRI